MGSGVFIASDYPPVNSYRLQTYVDNQASVGYTRMLSQIFSLPMIIVLGVFPGATQGRYVWIHGLTQPSPPDFRFWYWDILVADHQHFDTPDFAGYYLGTMAISVETGVLSGYT